MTLKEVRELAGLLSVSDYLLVSNLLHFVFCIFMVAYARIALDNQNNSVPRMEFKRFLIVVLTQLGFDMLSYVFDMQSFFGARLGNHVAMFFSVLLTAFVGALCNRFFDTMFRIHTNGVQRFVIYILPTVAMAMVLIVNLFNGWIYTIGEDNCYARGPFYFLSFFLQNISFVVIIIRAALFKFEVKTIRYRKMRDSIVRLGALTLAFGVLQAASAGKVAIQCFGITAGVFIMFFRFQDDQITNDLLTGMNNRYALDTYVADKIKAYADGTKGQRSLYFIMMDVNDFKRINDIYGHPEGDKALKQVALTLKKVGTKYKNGLFISRFGGDEFSAVYESSSEHQVKLLCEEIKERLKADTEEFSYRLTISVGYALYSGKEMSMDRLYSLADESLYEDKRGSKGGEYYGR